MFCTQCGKQNQDDAVYCMMCGQKIGTDNSSSEEQGESLASASATSVTLNSLPPAVITTAKIAMFKVKDMGIALEMDDVWGEKKFLYLNQQEMYDDCSKIFAALQQITKNMVMQFRSEGGPVVPIYRITKVYLNDWWKRLEVDIEGAGGQWFAYPDKNTLHADYNMLMSLMSEIQQR